jgi:predicted phage tail protein
MTFWGNNMFNVVSDMPADVEAANPYPRFGGGQTGLLERQ